MSGRTDGGSLLRAALDEAERQVATAAPGPRGQVTAFVAYDKESGAQVGMAYLWRTEKGREWTVTGALGRKATGATSPYAVRIELKGTL